MRINWHTLVAGLVALIAWVSVNVNTAALPHNVAVVLGVLGTVVATFSRPAVQAQPAAGPL